MIAPTPVEQHQQYENGTSPKRVTVVAKPEFLGKASNERVAIGFRECCAGWFGSVIADLIDVESDGTLKSRVSALVGATSSWQINTLIIQRLDAFLAGAFCGTKS